MSGAPMRPAPRMSEKDITVLSNIGRGFLLLMRFSFMALFFIGCIWSGRELWWHSGQLFDLQNFLQGVWMAVLGFCLGYLMDTW